MKTGNWNGFIAMLDGVEDNVKKELDKALKTVAYKVQRSMVTGITSKRFNLEPNAPSTVKQKKSSTPLIDKGDLVGSINVHRLPDGYLSGVHRTALSKDGKSLANIFAVHTFGSSAVDASGKRSGIPQRDAITPALKENENMFIDECQKAVERALRLK